MNINVDSAYRSAVNKPTGSEDRAISGTVGMWHYGIVSDGCGSCEKASLGAEILSLCCKKAIISTYESPTGALREEIMGFIAKKAVDEAASIIKSFDIPLQDAFSTLLFFITDGISLHVYVEGDGGFYFKDGSGEFLYWGEFTNNTPPYPFYSLIGGYEYYLPEIHRGLYQHVWMEHDLLNKKKSEVEARAIEEYEHQVFSFYFLDHCALDTFVIFSDGIDQVWEAPGMDEIKMPLTETARILSDFPSKKGNFAKRNLRHFFEKKTNGVHHNNFDDVSMAGLNTEWDQCQKDEK